jgi:hypothetical protein
MTIITALSSSGKIVLGHNDGHTVGDSPMPGRGYPWLRLGHWELGVSGSSGIFNVICHHATDFSESAGSAADMVFRLRSLLVQYGFGCRDNDEPEDRYGIWCILAHVDGQIWNIDEKLAYSQIPEGVLWARGSGGDYARGADFALSTLGVAPEARVRIATDAAIALDLFCGGASHVRTLE